MLRTLIITALFAVTPFSHGKATVNDQIAQLEEQNSPLLQYPTHFTQNIVVSARGCSVLPVAERLYPLSSQSRYIHITIVRDY
jgi:hypothetical protein